MSAFGKRGVRCDTCGKFSRGKQTGEYVRKDGTQGYIYPENNENPDGRDICSDCLDAQIENPKPDKNFYVLGQNGALGELIRCTDDGAAEVEFGQMHLSPCKRIARTTRPTTEDKALRWFEGQMTFIRRRDSNYNIAENTFEELGRKTRRGRDTLNAY